MERYNLATELFSKKCFFKMVCGAGNEDPIEVRRLATIYSLAGCACLDVSANPEVVLSAIEGIRIAKKIANDMNKPLKFDPFVNVSVGLPGDPHVRKAEISKITCVECMLCISVCEQKAIDDNLIVNEMKCIGCGKCADICSQNCIQFTNKKVELTKILPKCIENGAEMIELHAVSNDEESVFSDWIIIDSLIPDNYVSMCLDRSLLSDNAIKERINGIYQITGNRLIVQADGAPMGGGDDTYNTTLQAVATADIIQKLNLPIKILASGGTNSKTRDLADHCGVNIHGVSIGTYARKIVKKYIVSDDFDTDINIVLKSVYIAKELVKKSNKFE